MSAAVPIREALGNAKVASVEWSDPDMSILSAGRTKAAPIPRAVFSTAWPMIELLAEGAGSPKDYPAISFLAVAASLVGGKRRVQPFETTPQWREPCILWVGNVGDPSTNKSPGQDSATGDLDKMEQEHARAFEETLREHDTKVERAKSECKAWSVQVEEARKDGHDTPLKPEKAMAPDEPQRRRLVIRDTTPESIASILSGNHFGTLCLNDELAQWFSSFERYSPGGREFWLSANGGRPHTIDRKSSPKPIRIPFCGVTVIGSIQPDRLNEMLGQADDGLLSRFVWVWPDAIPYQRPRYVADHARLERIYRRLDGLQPAQNNFTGTPEARVLPMSDAAADTFEDWIRHNNADAAEAAGLYKSFLGKMRGMVARVALTAELIAWADSDVAEEPFEVGERAVAAAIEFFEDYAKLNAKRVFGDAALPPVERNAASIARYLVKNQITLFNPRDHRDNGPSILKDTERRDEAISHLVQGDWLKLNATRAGGGAGRAKNDYLVNPLALKVAA